MMQTKPVKVTLELGPYSSRILRLLTILQGGTQTAAAKAMVDLGCSIAADRVDAMSFAVMPDDATDVKAWQNTLLIEDEQKNTPDR